MKTNKKDIISILLGNTLLALAVILFIVPGHLLSGGTTGISLFLNHYFHLPISIFTFIFNFIVFIIGALILGKKFAWQKTPQRQCLVSPRCKWHLFQLSIIHLF